MSDKINPLDHIQRLAEIERSEVSSSRLSDDHPIYKIINKRLNKKPVKKFIIIKTPKIGDNEWYKRFFNHE